MNITDDIIVNKVKQSILSIDKDAEIILFGSRARGDARPDSDWDFLFLTSMPVNDLVRWSVADKVMPVELDEEIAVQVIIKNKKDWRTKYIDSPFYRNVEEQGIRL